MRNRLAALSTALLVTALVATPSQAQITFVGTTQGCFGTMCTPNTNPLTPFETLSGLRFDYGSFTATQSPVYANVGGTAGNSFGTFTLSNVPGHTYNDPFTLFLYFTQPGTGSGPQFAATVTGTVTTTSTGVDVTFDDPRTKSILLSDGTMAIVEVPNFIGVTANSGPVALTGRITATPEPASMTLLATGLVGIFGAARRRRKKLVG